MVGVRVETFLKTVPLELPFVREFATGFVASAIALTKERAEEIINCMTLCVPVEGLSYDAKFKWCPLLPSYAVDMVSGRPTDQAALDWDYPCGIEMAKDETAVYGCLDRTITDNAPWRRRDQTGWILAVRNRGNIPGAEEEYLLACIRSLT